MVLASYWDQPLSGRLSGERWLTNETDKSQEIPTLDASRETLKQSMIATILSLQQAGKKVVVLEDVPNFEFDPVLRARTASIPVRHALAVWLGTQGANEKGYAAPSIIPEAAVANSAIKEAIAGFSGVTLFDPKSELCRGTNECAYMDGDRLLYLDSHHVSPDGARYTLRNFKFPSLVDAAK